MTDIDEGKQKLSEGRRDALLELLRIRFERNMRRHMGLEWTSVRDAVGANMAGLRSLSEMERTGGEPDVIGRDEHTGEYIFCDCSAETPKGRRSVCYDDEALEARKEHKPKDSAVAMAAAMGIELLTEDEYQGLQALGEFDLKTSSWVRTPGNMRTVGGALFGDRRFGRVFFYHNGAESYYQARGFRGTLRV